MEIGFIRIVSGRPYSIISKYTKFSLKNAKIFTFHYNLIAFDKKCAHSWLEMLTDNAFTNSCCIGTLVKKSLYLSGFHQRYCLGNKTYYNLNCTRLRYFCPVFCLIPGCKNCARALLSAQGCEDMSSAELSFWVFSDHEWAQFMSKQIVLAISMQIFDGFYKTSLSRPDTRLNDRLFARILKYVRHAIVWSLKFDMIDRIGRVNSCRESNSEWHDRWCCKICSLSAGFVLVLRHSLYGPTK